MSAAAEIVLKATPVRMDIIESLVTKGDISGLNTEQRTQYYVGMCDRMGLDPATQPFSIVKQGPREFFYVNRGATDQLAATHRVNREIVDGPRLIELDGVKLIFCICRATLPNGRIETATATVPAVDLVNALMKCETKAKRRATLSILGLSMPDESEVETIRGAQRVEFAPANDPAPSAPPVAEAPEPDWAAIVAGASTGKELLAVGRRLIDEANLSGPQWTAILGMYGVGWERLIARASDTASLVQIFNVFCHRVPEHIAAELVDRIKEACDKRAQEIEDLQARAEAEAPGLAEEGA